jgi:hypothetical protein
VLQTQEFEGGRMVSVPQSFRGYESPEQSFMDYAGFVTSNPRYRPVLDAGSLEGQIRAMGASGYATDPNYATKLAQIAGMVDPSVQINIPGRGGNMQPQGLLGNATVSTQGREPEQAPFFQRPEVGNLLDTLAIGFSGMTLNPNQALIQSAQERIKGRRETAQTAQQRNRTLEYLRTLGTPQAMEAIRYAEATGDVAGALKMAQGQDPRKGVVMGDRLVDPVSGQVIADFSGTQSDMTTAVQSLHQRAIAGGLQPGSNEYRQFMIEGGAQNGMSLQVGADGSVSFGTGSQAGKPLTEGQSKDTVYATRAEGALPTLDQFESALTGIGDVALGADPTGFIRGRLQSNEYQLARQAGDEFLQAVLRKDTGAAITAQEQELYGKTYLPQPGDSPDVIAQKRQSRRRALEAIKAGLPPSAIVAQERALRESETASQEGQPSGSAPRIRYDANGNRIQ